MTLTRELPVASATLGLQVGEIGVHQEPRVVAPDARVCHPSLQGLEHLLLCHVEDAQVGEAGGEAATAAT